MISDINSSSQHKDTITTSASFVVQRGEQIGGKAVDAEDLLPASGLPFKDQLAGGHILLGFQIGTT